MSDPSEALSVTFGALLKNLVYNDRKVDLYDISAPGTAQPPYIILGPWTGLNASSKGRFGERGEITFDVFTRSPTNVFSKRPANQIEKQIKALVLPYPGCGLPNVEGFDCWMASFAGSQEITLPTPTDRIFRKLLTINLSLTQL